MANKCRAVSLGFIVDLTIAIEATVGMAGEM